MITPFPDHAEFPLENRVLPTVNIRISERLECGSYVSFSNRVQSQEWADARESWKRRSRIMTDETNYICPSCGEEIVIPIDASQGDHQEYVEDCPVCCCPVVLRVIFDEQGRVHCSAVPE